MNTSLNTKQTEFCKQYIKLSGNATKAYMISYSIDNYNTAKANASRLLTNANIKQKISDEMQDLGLNDIYIDLELLSLIKQNDNLGVKFRAIQEFNKIKKRYGDINSYIVGNFNTSSNISEKSLGEMSKQEKEQLRKRLIEAT